MAENIFTRLRQGSQDFYDRVFRPQATGWTKSWPREADERGELDEGFDKSGRISDPDEGTSLTIAAVYRCVSILSQAAAMLPLHAVRRRPNGSHEILLEHPLTRLLNEPNPWSHGKLMRQALMAQVLLHGNGYAYIYRSLMDGEVRELWPLQHSRIDPRLTEDNQVEYSVDEEQGRHSGEAMPQGRFCILEEPLPTASWAYQ